MLILTNLIMQLELFGFIPIYTVKHESEASFE